MKKNIQILFLLLFIFSYIVKAEAKIDYNDLNFKNINQNDGLTNTSINCIFGDSIGYLWFGSKTSLQRYDGEKLLDFPKQLAPNIKINTNNISYISYKNSNFYFLFKNRLMIFNVKHNNIKILRNKDYFIKKGENNFLNKCLIDRENNLWISTDKGLFKSIIKKGKIKSFELITLNKDEPQLQTLALYQDKYNNIWVGTKKGVYVYNEKEKKILNLTEKTWEIQPYSVGSIKEDKEGNIWVGQTKRLIKFSNKQNVLLTETLDINIYLFPDDNSFNYVIDFDFDAQGNIWILKPHMINILEFQKDSYKIHNIKYDSNIKNGLNSNNFNCIHINSHGIVFIGTKEGEIDIFNPYIKKIENLKPLNYNDNFNINCICKDHNNNLWISVNFNKLFYYIPNENKFISININRDIHIRNIIETKDHEIFFSSMIPNSKNGGLFRVNNTTIFYKTHNPKDLSLKLFNSLNIKNFNKENNSCFYTIQDIDSSFWFVAVKRGLFHFKYDGENFSLINHFSNHYFKKQKLDNVFIDNINILKDSSLIIASTCDKLIKYNREKKSFEGIEELRKGINPKKITDFTFSYLDNKERLWVGTEGNGVLRYDREKSAFKIFNKQNGLNSNNIYSFSIDKEKKNVVLYFIGDYYN